MGVALLFFAGCSSLPGGSRTEVTHWASRQGFHSTEIGTAPFHLLVLERYLALKSESLTVYLEGDGAPWPSPHHPPYDPTPKKSLVLALAAGDRTGAVAYLGRPCQYLAEESLSGCSVAYWTRARFAPEVISASNQALTILKQRAGARTLHLVGFSGGGVLAALLAAQRDDVGLLVTIAAPLALTQWSRWHEASPLTDSLDPMTQKLPYGVHFVGGKDEIVPPAIVEAFVAHQGGEIRLVPDFDHECCWAQAWPALLQTLHPSR